MTAMPSAPASSREVLSAPEATPAFSTGTAAITALVSGVVSAEPSAATSRPGKTSR